MALWIFDETQAKEFDFKPIPVGDHRVRIDTVIPQDSKTGREMWKLVLDVSGNTGKLFYYLVFMPDKPEITNTNLKQIYESFGITKGDMDLTNWMGKVGACKVVHEEYNGKTSPKVSYFIKKELQDTIPMWKEPEKRTANTVRDGGIPF